MQKNLIKVYFHIIKRPNDRSGRIQIQLNLACHRFFGSELGASSLISLLLFRFSPQSVYSMPAQLLKWIASCESL